MFWFFKTKKKIDYPVFKQIDQNLSVCHLISKSIFKNFSSFRVIEIAYQKLRDAGYSYDEFVNSKWCSIDYCGFPIWSKKENGVKLYATVCIRRFNEDVFICQGFPDAQYLTLFVRQVEYFPEYQDQ